MIYNTAASEKPVGAIIIDGKDNDWSDLMTTYIEDLDGMMGVAHDDSSLILMFRFPEQDLTRKVMMGGATLWWHHEGKKKKEYGIKFPMQRPQPGSRPDRMERTNDRDTGRERTKESPSFPMELISPVLCIEKTGEKLPWSDVNGIAASAGMKKGELCFEFRIPIRPDNPYSLVSKPGKNFKVCLELGEKVDMSSMRPPMDEGGAPGGGMGGGRSGRGGGDGMGPGGMGGPGGPGGGPADMQDMFKPEEVWVTVQLP
ncbi:MAG TPA: hypothetical protein PLP19_12635 [bacterium]|nr:hypothetical protein [bacterium]HPN44331.1 hypothetical protein [bacterium]